MKKENCPYCGFPQLFDSITGSIKYCTACGKNY